MLCKAYLMCLFISAGTLAPIQARGESAVDSDGLYQAAKADLEEGRFAFALEKLKRGLQQGVADRELLWTYRLAIAVAYDQLQQPQATLEAIQVLDQALSSEDGGVPEAWRARLEGMRRRAAELESSVLRTYGALEIGSTPGHARVFVDGAPQGEDGAIRTPFRIYLPPGERVVRVALEEYKTVDSPLNVRAGSIRKLHVNLERLATRGVLKVLSGDPLARAMIDGVEEGSGAELRLDLAAGTHSLRVERDGYTAYEEEITVTAGATTTRRVSWAGLALVDPGERPPEAGVSQSRRAPAWLKPMWGWITVGAGAAVLAAGVPFTVMAYDDHSSLAGMEDTARSPDNLTRYANTKDSMQTNETVAGLLYGVGATAIAGGATWLLFAYTWEAVAEDTAVSVLPLPGGATFTFSGRW